MIKKGLKSEICKIKYYIKLNMLMKYTSLDIKRSNGQNIMVIQHVELN